MYFNFNVNFFVLPNIIFMDLKTKKERLSLIKKSLEKNFRKVENIGSVFFVSGCNGCVLRDVVYRRSQSIGLEFEVLSLDEKPYFVGTKDHATALFIALGGSYSPCEFCYCLTHHMSLWVWIAPEKMEKLDVEEAKNALF